MTTPMLPLLEGDCLSQHEDVGSSSFRLSNDPRRDELSRARHMSQQMDSISHLPNEQIPRTRRPANDNVARELHLARPNASLAARRGVRSTGIVLLVNIAVRLAAVP